MLEIGDTFLYHPSFSHELDDNFLSIEIIRRLVNTNSFFIMSICHSKDSENEPKFTTEIRPTPIVDGEVQINNSLVQFTHNQERILNIDIQDEFHFDKVISLFDKKKRNELLYIMDLFQELCKGAK